MAIEDSLHRGGRATTSRHWCQTGACVAVALVLLRKSTWLSYALVQQHSICVALRRRNRFVSCATLATKVVLPATLCRTAPCVREEALIKELSKEAVSSEDPASFVKARLSAHQHISNDEMLVDTLVLVRDEARRSRSFAIADALRSQLRSEYSVLVQDHINGSSTWIRQTSDDEFDAKTGATVRSLAHGVMKLASQADSVQAVKASVDNVTAEILDCLGKDVANTKALHGRQYADVAFALAIAGSDSEDLFRQLAKGAAKELKRAFGRTPPVVVAQIIERCAVAGIREKDCPALFRLAADALHRGGFPASSATLRDLQAGNFSLHSERPLRWLFRHALRQGRRSVYPADSDSIAKEAVAQLGCHISAQPKPLIVDLGCGFGVGNLGLSCTEGDWQILAVDASAHCIGYAQSIARRWRLPPERLCFAHCDAMAAVNAVTEGYLGPVQWILVNFPTPYAAVGGEQSGNSHLPRSANSSDFMANSDLLAAARACLLSRGNGRGALLVQSQCEDVAVTLRTLAEASGWVVDTMRDVCGDGSVEPSSQIPAEQWMPRRQLRWRAGVGSALAEGPGWLRMSPLPPIAATETERFYEESGLPVYRVVLRPRE